MGVRVPGTLSSTVKYEARMRCDQITRQEPCLAVKKSCAAASAIMQCLAAVGATPALLTHWPVTKGGQTQDETPE